MTTKFNGASYIVQRGAAALFSDDGKAQVTGLIEHYLGNAAVLREAARDAGLTSFGGVNAPYIWVKTPGGLGSWEFFDVMLNKLNVVVTPGAGFGAAGEGYFRISAFNSRANADRSRPPPARRIVGDALRIKRGPRAVAAEGVHQLAPGPDGRITATVPRSDSKKYLRLVITG